MTRENDRSALPSPARPDAAATPSGGANAGSLDALFGDLDREIAALDPPPAPSATPHAPARLPTLSPAPAAARGPSLTPVPAGARAPSLTPAPSLASARAPSLTPAPSLASARAPSLTPVPSLASARAPSLTPAPSLASARAPSLTPVPTAPPVEAEPAWPAPWPGTDELDDLLARGMVGLFDGPPLGPVAQRVIQALSPVERAVLGGDSPEVDGEVVRRAMRMRLRVGAALATAPSRGTRVDGDALSALLAEMDAVLAAVASLAADAPQTVQLSLDGMREDLVKEAIDLSEAAQAIAPLEATAPAAAPQPRTTPLPRTRVLSVAEGEDREARGNRGLAVVFVLCLAGAGAFWGMRLYGRAPPERPTVAGAPSNALAIPPARNGVTMLRSADGRPFTADEVRAFVQQENAKGNAVRQVSPGMLVVVPPSGGSAAGGAK